MSEFLEDRDELDNSLEIAKKDWEKLKTQHIKVMYLLKFSRDSLLFKT